MQPLLTATIASILSMSLMLAVNLPDNSLLWSAVQNSGHFVIFTLLSCFTFRILRPTRFHTAPLHQLLICAALLALASLIELIQGVIPGRDASWDDMLLDTMGIATGYLIFTFFHRFNQISNSTRAALAVTCLAIGIKTLQPVLAISAYHILKSGPPSIVSFADPFVLSTIKGIGNASATVVNIKPDNHERSIRMLRMDFANQIYSGVVLHDTSAAWNDEGTLGIQLFNRGGLRRVVELRIHDKYHNNKYNDRFDRTLVVEPGINEFSIPLEQIKYSRSGDTARGHLDMNNITEIQFFSSDKNPFSLYLSGLFLRP
ncbi:hypothetical protein AB833_20600 [Chromatiales bacterium (ex Bugula neritina AB1)]|nr:hypothetical protein AB833_20600 [Chromatiales bacterium (ex Bugula neritina AB1)]